MNSLALIEVSSIARGVVVLDALTKRAIVRVLRSEAVSPGKFLILFAGQEADVDEAFAAGRAAAGTLLIDSLLLFDPHASLLPLVQGHQLPLELDQSLSIQEYASVASGLLALDRALKAANVQAHKLRLALGIGGKAYFVLGGTLSDVQAAQDAAWSAVAEGQRVLCEIIPRLSPDVQLEHL